MRFVLTATFVALAATASAQKILVAPKLRAGDTFQLEINRTRENTPPTPEDGKGRTTIDVRVLTVTPEGATLEWESGVMSGTVGGVPEALMLNAGDAMRGMKPVIRLTPRGEVAGLVNEAEVLAKMQAAVDIIRRDLVEKVAPDSRQGFEAMLSQVLSPAMLVTSVVRDAGIYFGLSGVELGVGETATTELPQPNPFGGEPLPAKFAVRFEATSGDSATFVTTSAYDAAALARAMSRLVDASGKPIPKEDLAKLPVMQIADEGRFEFDRTLGLMREASVTRRVTAGNTVRLDRTDIRLLTPPSR